MLFACILATATLASQKLIYEPFVVPQLASWQAIPWSWWFTIFAPEFAVCAAAVAWARGINEVLLFCLFGALLVEALLWIADLLNQPGHYKTIEGGAMQFIVHYIVVAVLLLIISGSLFLLRMGWRRVRAS
jgi:hypothetical protein